MMLNPSPRLLLGASAAFAQDLVIDPACARLAPMQYALAGAEHGLHWCSSKEKISVGTTFTTVTETSTEYGTETSTSTHVVTENEFTTKDTTVFAGTATSTAAISTITSTATSTTTSYKCAAGKVERAERPHRTGRPTIMPHQPSRPASVPHRPSRPVFDPVHTPWAMPSRNSSFPAVPVHSGVVSWNSTSASPSPRPTPTPTPGPHCSGAPSEVEFNACHDIARACSCLGKLSVTFTVTKTATATAFVITVETTNSTTVVTSTTTSTITSPAETTTSTPLTTTTTTTTSTTTTCPCASPSPTLCGSTPNTCSDLQTDNSNCGSCGHTCASGYRCYTGKCVISNCNNVQTCQGGFKTSCDVANEGGCYCLQGTDGTRLCGDIGVANCSTYKTCTADGECVDGEICATQTCCGHGICVQGKTCPVRSGARIFRKDGGMVMPVRGKVD